MKSCIRCLKYKDEVLFKVQKNHIHGSNYGNVCLECDRKQRKRRKEKIAYIEPMVKVLSPWRELSVEERRERVKSARAFCEWATNRANEIRSPE